MLDEFLNLNRLPRASELILLCKELEIDVIGDPPILKVNEANRAEGKLLAKIMRREPWRSEIIETIGLMEKVNRPTTREVLFPGTGLISKSEDNPVGAYFYRENGGEWQPIPGRTWKGRSP